MTDRRSHRRLAGSTTDRAGGFTGDDRGVAEVLGAILMFALVVLVLVLVQLNAVPAANQQVEFEHNQRAQGDMGEFQEALTRSATTGTESTTTIETGIGYQPRLFLLNPPRASGTVETVASGEVRIANARAAGAAGDYWTGSDRTFESGGLAYRPNYNEYPNPPTTVYENGVLYNRFDDDRSVIHERGALISGDTISLIALQGSVSTGSDQSVSVGTTPISGPARTITVSDTGAPIELTVPTELSVESWREVLADEMSADGHVTAVQSAGDDAVLIELEQGVTYNLRMAAVGIGSGFDAETSAQYVVAESGNGTVVPEGGSQRLVAEVRDGFNNPVSNVTIANTTNLAGASVRFVEGSGTAADGQIDLLYTAPNVDGTTNASVTVSFGGNSSDRQRVRFDVSVIDTDESGRNNQGSGGNPINPAEGDAVVLTDADLEDCSGGTGTSPRTCQRVEMTFQNLYGETRSIDEIQMAFYNANQQFQGAGPGPPSSPRPLPDSATIVNDSEGFTGGTELQIGGTFEPASLEAIPGGQQRSYDVQFRRNLVTYDVIQADFFVVTVVYDNGEAATYFVAPSE